jgi:predicted pyridoxine 5'-phosphate oxidase superfamily flavin-nucleotide-binding protein
LIHPTFMLTPEVHEYASRSVLCWLATADRSGSPNVSPKEIFATVGDTHVVVANIASPRSARNIEANAKVCVSFIDVFVQKGFKVTGHAKNVKRDERDFSTWAAPLMEKAGPRFPIQSVFVIEVTEVQAILAPSYRLHATETTEDVQIASAMRAYGVRPSSDV